MVNAQTFSLNFQFKTNKTMVKHEYNVITGSSYTCDVVDRRQLLIKGFRTEKKSKKQKYGKEKR
jgi:hypothetical protein